MNNIKSNVYSKIFDIVESNMINSCGRGLEYTKSAFITTVNSDLTEVDIFALSKLDNISLIHAAYTMLLFRTIDEVALENWKIRAEESPNLVKENLIKSILRSQEFLIKGASIKNNIYSSENCLSPAIPACVIKPNETNANNAFNKLYRIYKRLPRLIKIIIKKILACF